MLEHESMPTWPRPPVFYKYLPVESWLPNLLNGTSLLFSSRLSFNDPFDCRPAIKMNTEKRGRDFFKDQLKKTKLPPSKRLTLINTIMRRSKIDDNLDIEQTQENLDNVGVLCLAESWDNALMWSHYAKIHKGIAVGFHSNKSLFWVARPIEYTDELPIIFVPTTASEELFNQTFLKKAKCWAYESEWRIVKPPFTEEMREKQFFEFIPHMSVADARRLADQRGAGIYDFCKTAVESVTLGMRISDDDAAAVVSAIASAGLNIPIYKVLPPSTTYSLSRTLYTKPDRTSNTC